MDFGNCLMMREKNLITSSLSLNLHSTANAYEVLCKSVPEIEHLVKKLSLIATFFHATAKRTSDLEKVGAKENLTVHRIPKYFEVKWSEIYRCSS